MQKSAYENDMRARLGLSEVSLRALIGKDSVFRGIWDDLLLVCQALEHWEEKNGPDSHEAVQYRDIQKEHVEEIRTILNRRNISGGDL